ncbi:MAG: RNA methyltransferase [Bacteroidales bacterium]|nr:RNA methyltransferase [Bacteroidales bacterium]
MTTEITSASNPRIKELLALEEKSRERREKSLFVVEGRREIEHCCDCRYVVDTLFVCREIAGDWTLPEASSVVEVPSALYSKIAYREGTEGAIAIVRAREHALGGLALGKDPLVIVLESVEKPGNLGAVLRSADAAGADAVIVCDPLTDIYNPNLIRASLGAVFSRQIAVCSSSEAISFLKEHNIQVLTAQLQDSSLYYDCDMRRGTAIVIGTESTGLSDVWRKAADRHIRIPMKGEMDSLNASVSAAILLFEAVRQRG